MARIRKMVAAVFAGSLLALAPAAAQAAPAVAGDQAQPKQQCAMSDVCFWDQPLFAGQRYIETNYNPAVCHLLPWQARSVANESGYDLVLFHSFDCSGPVLGIVDAQTQEPVLYPTVGSYRLAL